MDSMFNTPQEVVQANMNGAVKKAATSKKKVFFMGIMAGVCIALGAQSRNVAMHDISNVGLARLVAGCVFPVFACDPAVAAGAPPIGACGSRLRPDPAAAATQRHR